MTSNARELAQIPSTPSGRRNLVFNGDMRVNQRGTLTGQTGNSYTACDRFLTAEGGAAVTTSSQSTDVPSGQGFANSLKIDITTADTDISANDYFLLIQRLEGQDLQHLLYGTSDAKDLTISFWIKSPKTGTHILELRHNDATYYNAQAYTITSANTWQKVTLTYSGYVTTAFDNDNNFSLAMQWWFAAGSNFSSGTLQSNTWQNTATNRAVGQVNCLDSTSNEIYLTGVQLEVGSVATEFEHRSFGEELALCQRYCVKIKSHRTNPSLFGRAWDSNTAQLILPIPVEMRGEDVHYQGTGSFTKHGDVAINAFVSSGNNVTAIENWVVVGTQVGFMVTTTGTIVGGNTVWWGINDDAYFLLEDEL